MESLNFGTFDIKKTYSSFSAPSILSKEMMNKISFVDTDTLKISTNYLDDSSEDNEVTHESYFGENIRRAINILSNKH